MMSHAYRALAHCAKAAAVSILFLLTISAGIAHATTTAPRADTRIEAQAEVSYIAPGTPGRITSLSNIVFVIVMPVEALAFDDAGSVSTPAGKTAVIPLVLANTGNVSSTYDFAIGAPGAAELDDVRLYRDANANGIVDDGPRWIALKNDNPSGGEVTLAAGETAALLLVAEVRSTASGNPRIKLSATTRMQHVKADTDATFSIAGGAAMQLTLGAQPTASQVGATLNFSLHAKNVGSDAALLLDDVDSRQIRVDGIAQSALLLTIPVPAQTRYVPNSLTSTAGIRTLVRTRTDDPFSYRSDVPDGHADEVVELALALDTATGLASGGAISARFQLQVDDAFAATALNTVAHARFRETAQGRAQDVLSNTAVVTIGALDVPDLVPQLTTSGDFVIGREVVFTTLARNIGSAMTNGPLTITGTLPVGMQVVSAAGPDDWHCTTQQQEAVCTSSQRIAPGAASSPFELRALITPDAIPSGQAQAELVISASVAGGGEPKHLSGNNTTTYRATIAQGATLSGRVWIDLDDNDRYAEGEKTLSGWRAQLLYSAPQAAGGFALQSEAVTDASGRYQINGVMPDRRYSLRILSPDGKIYGMPHNGDNAGTVAATQKAESEADQHRAMLHYTKLTAGHHYHNQDLALVPGGIVYDALTRKPIAGATIKLRPEHGKLDRARDLVGGDDAVSTTTDDGFYFVTLTPDAPAGQYRIGIEAGGYETQASALLPPQAEPIHLSAGSDRRIARQGRVPRINDKALYYNTFIRSKGAGRLFNNHIPLDPIQTSTFALTLTHQADRSTVELIDFVNYTLTLKHQLAGSLTGFIIVDDLPRGFDYVRGSARLNIGSGAALPVADPDVNGKRLTFNLANAPLSTGVEAKLTIRVRVGATAVENSKATSSAKASSGSLSSNLAETSVNVVGGVFSTDAFVAGKVFFDCNGDGVQNPGESGVPGVRIYMENGTFAETDVDGKYSLYGLKPLTHVLKLDPTTLPPGSHSQVISSRNAGNGDSRFLDVRNGELGRGDFALSCPPDSREQVAARRAALQTPDEIETVLKQRMESQYVDRMPGMVKARPASGIVDGNGTSRASVDRTADALNADDDMAAMQSESTIADVTPSTPEPAPAGGTTLETGKSEAPSSGSEVAIPVQSPTSVPFDQLLPQLDSTLGFISPRDAEIMRSRQTTVRVKGHAGSTFALLVNGQSVSTDAVAQRSELAARDVGAWEYIGIALQAGRNVLTVRETRRDGSAGAERSITVVAPGQFAQLEVRAPLHPVADGKTPVAVEVLAVDADGIAVSARLPVTLSANGGQWQVRDLDPLTPGIQTFIQGGATSFELTPPSSPGEVVVEVKSGKVKTERRIGFIPELRPMIAAGIIEGVVTLRNTKIDPISGHDNGFERELTRLSQQWDNGRNTAAARAAFFLKGKVKGEYLLTASFDSEKNVKERLFRDIEPDRYYPVYGDSSVRGYDAQSTGRLYLRIDKNRSFLLYGDFSTGSDREVRQLTQYDRAVTGLTHHYEDDRLKTNLFVSHDDLVQNVIELPAHGFGPYTVPDYVENSERVEIVTRDQDQRGTILKSQPLTRFADYQIEVLSGHMLLKDPVPRIDPATNGFNSIRITYETDGNGVKFWLFGGDAQIHVLNGLTLGVVAVEDQNPADWRRLQGLTAFAQLGPHTTLAAEYARTLTARRGTGEAGRIELRHESEKLKAHATATRTDDNFDNISSPISAGRLEARAKAEYQLDERYTLKGEALRTQDNGIAAFDTGTSLFSGAADGIGAATLGNESLAVTGVLFGIERRLTDYVSIEVGSRFAKGTLREAGEVGHIDLITARARVTSAVPGVPKATVYGEYEQDVRTSEKRALALGGEYRLSETSRAYARHELISSLGSLYELNGSQRTFRTIAGVDSAYMKDGRVFSEYREGGAISGRDAQAAVGVRNGWEVREGLRLGTLFERTRTVGNRSAGSSESTAVAGSVEYLANPNWKGSATLELRRANEEDSVLNTFGLAFKLSPDWTLLGKSAIYRVMGRGERHGSDSVRMRQRIGFAYRQTDLNAINALAYYEHRLESGRTTVESVDRYQAHMFSAVANIQPVKHTTISTRYAAKHVSQHGRGGHSSMTGQLLSARVTRDIATRWDVGLAASTMFDNTNQQKNAIGAELGYRFQKDLWVSLGYNAIGFYDREFSTLADTVQGMYFRLRYKFDENSFSFSRSQS